MCSFFLMNNMWLELLRHTGWHHFLANWLSPWLSLEPGQAYSTNLQSTFLAANAMQPSMVWAHCWAFTGTTKDISATSTQAPHPSMRGPVSTGKNWGVYRHTTRCSRPVPATVSVVLQCKLLIYLFLPGVATPVQRSWCDQRDLADRQSMKKSISAFRLLSNALLNPLIVLWSTSTWDNPVSGWGLRKCSLSQPNGPCGSGRTLLKLLLSFCFLISLTLLFLIRSTEIMFYSFVHLCFVWFLCL